MKVALYARVSIRVTKNESWERMRKTREQETENQLIMLREYCKRNGWEVYKEYVDRQSGKSDDRTEFQRLFEDARLHHFDLVVFWSLDRFSREGVLATLQHLQKLDSYNVAWKSYTEQYLDSLGVFKEAVLAILATIAKQERIRIVERVNAGLDRARAKGKTLGRQKLDTSYEEADKLRKQGLSIREIAKRLKVSRPTITRRLKEGDAETIFSD